MPEHRPEAANSRARASSVAFKAECAFDEVEQELKAASSTAFLLSYAEILQDEAKDAFRGLANLLDATIARVQKHGEEFNSLGESPSVETIVN